MTNTNREDSEESKEKLFAEVRRLIGTGQLRLSTADEIRTHFHCVIRTAYTTPKGAKQGTTYFLERDEGHVGILACSDEGLPFSYITNDLLVALDRESPGRLLIREKINPIFHVGGLARGSTALCDVSFDSRADSPKVDVDLGELIGQVIEHAQMAKRLGRHTIQIRSEHNALIELDLGEGKAELLPISSFFMSGTSGDSLAIGSIGAGQSKSIALLGISQNDVRALGMPVKSASAEESGNIDVSTREGFGRDLKEKSAAEHFFRLFRADRASRSGNRFAGDQP